MPSLPFPDPERGDDARKSFINNATTASPLQHGGKENIHSCGAVC